MCFTYRYNFSFHSLSGCPLNAQAIKKGKVSEELMTIKVKASGGKRAGRGGHLRGLDPGLRRVLCLNHPPCGKCYFTRQEGSFPQI